MRSSLGVFASIPPLNRYPFPLFALSFTLYNQYSMDQPNKAALDKAITLLREGYLKEAQQILTDLAMKDSQNPQIWFLLGYALTQRDKKIYAFKQVLKLHPGHEKAKQMLEKLGVNDQIAPQRAAPDQAATPEPPPPVPTPEVPPEQAPFATTPAPQPEPAPTFPPIPQPTMPMPAAELEPQLPKIPDAPAPEPAAQPEPEQPATPPLSQQDELRRQLGVSSDPDPEPKSSKKKKRRKYNRGVMLVSTVVLAITIIGVDFVFTGGLDDILGIAQDPNGTPAHALTTTEEPTPQMTPSPEAGLGNTLTPTAAATASPTPTRTPTPTRLPQSLIDMQTIQQQVSELRQLSPDGQPVTQIISKSRLKLLIGDLFINEEFIASLEDEQIVMQALGFSDRNYDLITAAHNSLVDVIGGFYEMDTNRIYLVGDHFGTIEKWVYAHEYAHALQDQHLNLASLGIYPDCQKTLQACLAIKSLVEGDAGILQDMWLTAYPSGLPTYDNDNYDSYVPLFHGPLLPPYYDLNIYFPYFFGREFVSYLYEEGGWNLVNLAYQSLPTTTEQIMHPQLYISRHGAVPLDSPGIGIALDSSWRLVRRESLGEWETFLLLGYPVKRTSQRPDSEAFPAAAGWGGDTYQVYYNDEENETVLAVHWTWDTPVDAKEFYDSLKRSLNGRFQYARADGPGQGQCWSYQKQYSCIYTSGMDILWLLTPDLGTMESLKAIFPQFP